MFIAALVFMYQSGSYGDFWSWVWSNLFLVALFFVVECAFEAFARMLVSAVRG